MGFRLETYIIGLITFSLIIVCGVLLANDINSNYGTDLANESTSGFNATFATANTIIDDTESDTTNMKSDIEGDIEDDSVEDSMFKGGFKMIKRVLGMIILPANVITDITTAIGLPSIFAIIGNIVFMILIVFSILYLIFRFKPS